MLNSFHGQHCVIRAATIIEQRPSGRHVERWQVRVEAKPEGGFGLYIGGQDPIYYAAETEAIQCFDSTISYTAEF